MTKLFENNFFSLRCAILGEIKNGKSTLLSCLVGGNKIDKGHIWVLGGKPRTKSSRTLSKFVGYMPQVIMLLIQNYHLYNIIIGNIISYNSHEL